MVLKGLYHSLKSQNSYLHLWIIHGTVISDIISTNQIYQKCTSYQQYRIYEQNNTNIGYTEKILTIHIRIRRYLKPWFIAYHIPPNSK